MNKIERKAREDFFIQTGKTPEQEAKDSGKALSLSLIAAILIAAGLIGYLLS